MTAPHDAPTLLSPGSILASKYRILRLIGRGGMAEVYAAHHELLHQTVALKVLLPEAADTPQATTRFINEARAAARIRGENIATVMDVGTLDDGSAFMVLEYLEGSDLEAYAKERGPLQLLEVVDYVLQALQAIAQAHAKGIVHRDLKPSNLYLARQPDGGSVVKVLDFGISKALRSAEAVDGNSTSTQAILGSPFYMSPEQARSAKTVDARTDIWAIGVTLYRLLTGAMPFKGETLTELLLSIVQDTPRPLRELRPDLPAEVEGIVDHCLRKDRTQRFETVADLASALQPFGGSDAARIAGRVSRTLAAVAPTEPPPPMPGISEGGPQVAQPSKGNAVSPGPATTASWAESSASATAPRGTPWTRLVAVGAGVAAIGVGAAVFVSLRARPRDGSPAGSAPGPVVSAVTALPPPVASIAAASASALLPPPAPSASAVTSTPALGSAPSPPAVAGPRRSTSPAAPTTAAAAASVARPAPTPVPAPSAPAYDVLNQRN